MNCIYNPCPIHYILVTRNNKKFELILTRHAKAYSSPVHELPAISSQLGLCTAAEDHKNQ